MKTSLRILAVALVSIMLSSFANAQEKLAKKEISWPELEQDAQLNVRAASSRMKCFVDTPALDRFTYNRCFSVGNNRTTSAVFRIDGGPTSNFRVYWSDSRCSSTSKTCVLPIRWYQSIRLSADLLDLSNGTFSSSAATAHYEGFH